jgi:hypothetical protein
MAKHRWLILELYRVLFAIVKRNRTEFARFGFSSRGGSANSLIADGKPLRVVSCLTKLWGSIFCVPPHRPEPVKRKVGASGYNSWLICRESVSVRCSEES